VGCDYWRDHKQKPVIQFVINRLTPRWSESQNFRTNFDLKLNSSSKIEICVKYLTIDHPELKYHLLQFCSLPKSHTEITWLLISTKKQSNWKSRDRRIAFWNRPKLEQMIYSSSIDKTHRCNKLSLDRLKTIKNGKA